MFVVHFQDLTQLLNNNDEFYFESCLSLAAEDYSPNAKDILQTYHRDNVLYAARYSQFIFVSFHLLFMFKCFDIGINQ
jgi:hypothetical protein